MNWEYKIVYINAKRMTSSGLPNDLNLQFDKFGKEGWELVKVEPKLDGGLILFGFGWLRQTVG